MPARIHQEKIVLDKYKKDQLEAFLSQVKQHDLEKLVTAVEMDRLDGEGSLPHENLLEIMRPALREKVFSSRVPTPERLFCTAFEDLLNALPGRRKQYGRISRASIRPMWTWLREDLIPDQFEGVESKIKDLVLANKMDEAMEVVRDLQLVAGQYMHEELDKVVRDEDDYKVLCERLGGEAVVADLRDMAMCLEVADGIEEVRKSFERPCLGFDEEGLANLKRLYEGFCEHMPDHSVYCLLAILGRMARPWEILSAIETLTEQDSLDVSAEDMAIINELLLDDVDIVGLSFVDIRPEDADHDELLENLNIFVQITGGVVRGGTIQRDEVRMQRFQTTRRAVSQQMGKFVEVMPSLILQALPCKTSGDHGVRMPRIPDTSRTPSNDEVTVSLELAKLFVELRLYADQAGFGAAYSRAAREFDHRYERFKNDILDLIRQLSDKDLHNAECFVEVLAQIGEVYKGDVEAEMIRHRASSAAAEGPSPISVALNS